MGTAKKYADYSTSKFNGGIQMTSQKIIDTFVDFGEIDIEPVNSKDYRHPYDHVYDASALPHMEIKLVGRPCIHCNVQSLTWPVSAKKTARLVEDFDEYPDLQARFGGPNRNYKEPRWQTRLTPANYAEVYLRSPEYVFCQPALIVEEEMDLTYSDMPKHNRYLVPLTLKTTSSGNTTNVFTSPNFTFKGIRLLCEAVNGSLDNIVVDRILAANLSLLVGDGDVAAGIFHPLVSPELYWPTLTPAHKIDIELRNVGLEPVRVRVRVEGKGLIESFR